MESVFLNLTRRYKPADTSGDAYGLDGDEMTCEGVLIPHLLLFLGTFGKALPRSVSSSPPCHEGMLCFTCITSLTDVPAGYYQPD